LRWRCVALVGSGLFFAACRTRANTIRASSRPETCFKCFLTWATCVRRRSRKKFFRGRHTRAAKSGSRCGGCTLYRRKAVLGGEYWPPSIGWENRNDPINRGPLWALTMWTPGPLETMRIPLLSGLGFSRHFDREKTPPRWSSVNEAMAKMVWRAGRPRRKSFAYRHYSKHVPGGRCGTTIVGPDREDPQPVAYPSPCGQQYSPSHDRRAPHG